MQSRRHKKWGHYQKVTIPTLLVCFFSLFSFVCFGQMKINTKSHSGVELQQYPTGFLFSLYHGVPVTDHLFIDIRLGYNLVRHGDAGVQSDERGGGYGGSVGLYWTTGVKTQWPRKAWIFGVRSDLWYNEIDWIHRSADCIDFCEQPGKTDVTVLQPTAIIGHQFPIGSDWLITPTLAFGAEINIEVDGAEVGEGAIFLWGLRFTHLW